MPAIALTPRRLHRGLLLCGLLLLPLLFLVEADVGSTGLWGPLLLRQLLSVPVVLFVPGVPLALTWLKGELTPPALLDEGEGVTDLSLLLLAAALCSMPCQLLFVALLKLTIGVAPAPLLLLTLAAGVGLDVWLGPRMDAARLVPAPPERRRVMRWFGGLLAVFCLYQGPALTRDLSDLVYDPVLSEVGEEDPSPPPWGLGLASDRSQPLEWPHLGSFTPTTDRLELGLSNDARLRERMLVAFLIQGPVGVRAGLFERAEDGTRVPLVEELIEQRPAVSDDPEAERVERYWRWGTASLVEVVDLPPQSARRFELALMDEAGAPLDEAALAQLSVFEFSHPDPPRAAEALQRHRFKRVHYHQILNVAENVRWVDEYLYGARWATLNQPPLWSWIYGPLTCLAGRHLFAAAVVLLLILTGGFTVCCLALESTYGRVRAVTFLPAALPVLLHGQLMLQDVSQNFPDNLFTLSLLAVFLAALARRPRSFLGWALAASLLRYPGAVVAGFALLSVALFTHRRLLLLPWLRRFATALCWFCAGALLLGLVVRDLQGWVSILWFEFWPEHFANNPDPLPLWQRPLWFAQLLFAFSAALLPFALIPNRLSRAALLTVLLYAPFLAFIDHFSHHYFLPLQCLIGLAAASGIRSVRNPERRQLLAALALLMGVVSAAVVILLRW